MNGFGIEATAEEIGIGVVAAMGTLTAAHAVDTVVKKHTTKKREGSLPATREEALQACLACAVYIMDSKGREYANVRVI